MTLAVYPFDDRNIRKRFIPSGLKTTADNCQSSEPPWGGGESQPKALQTLFCNQIVTLNVNIIILRLWSDICKAMEVLQFKCLLLCLIYIAESLSKRFLFPQKNMLMTLLVVAGKASRGVLKWKDRDKRSQLILLRNNNKNFPFQLLKKEGNRFGKA